MGAEAFCCNFQVFNVTNPIVNSCHSTTSIHSLKWNEGVNVETFSCHGHILMIPKNPNDCFCKDTELPASPSKPHWMPTEL